MNCKIQIKIRLKWVGFYRSHFTHEKGGGEGWKEGKVDPTKCNAACKIETREPLSEWMINGPVEFSLLFLARTLCPFVPTFREMAGVLLALMDDATELIFALRYSVLFLALRVSD